MWIWFFDAVDAAQATWFVAHKVEGSPSGLVELLLPEEMGTTLPADKATATWAAGSEIKHGLQVNCMGNLLDAEGSAGARVQLLGYLRSHDPPRWILDADGTLSPTSHPDLVLGWGKMMRQEHNTVSQDTAVLMTKGSESGSVVRLVEGSPVKPSAGGSAVDVPTPDGSFALRLADGRGLVAKGDWVFDHPNGSGLKCLNIDLEVGTGDRAARVRLRGTEKQCTLILEERAGLHVSHGPPGPNVLGSQVIFHANKPRGADAFEAAQDKWQWDRLQGSLVPCANPALVLGELSSAGGVGLVERGSSKAFRFVVTASAEATTPLVVAQAAPIPMAAPLVQMGIHMGIVLDGQVEMTLIQQVEVFKRELGLSGPVSEVVHQAAEQLGVATEGKGIAALATACMRVLSDRR